jgi:hypothetical protein
VVLLAVAAVILIGVIAVAVGRGGELDPAEADYRPVDLDEVTSTDVALMRPPTALFGYHREATDAAFGQIARAISEREVEIATLRRQLAEQLPARTSPALRPEPPLRPEPLPPEAGPVPRAGLPTRPPTRPPARLPAEPPADGPWQPPQDPPLPSRPASSWPPPATTKAGSLPPEPMPNSSMPHIPRTGRDQAEGSGPAGFAAAPDARQPSGSTQPPGPLPVRPTPSRPMPSRPVPPRPATPPTAPGAQDPPDTPAGTHSPDQGSLPSRPSVLHRELADRPGPPQPGAEADPWLVWQRRSDPADAGAAADPAGADDATDPGEQR